MLRVIESGTTTSYPVPWRVDRADRRHPRLRNGDTKPLGHVRVFRTDGTTEHWGRLESGEEIVLCLCGADPDDTVITVCWFRARTAQEYVWRFVM